jgi:hypothetical protein
VRIEADINPSQFFLGPPGGVVEIENRKVSVAGSEPRWSRMQFSRRQPIELDAEDCKPVSVRFRAFIRLRSRSLRWRRLTFRPHEESIASCLAALEHEGFALDQKAAAIAGNS